MLRRKLSGASRRALSTAIRPRRSALYLPGSNARALEKAKSLPCDVLLLDCEDAVAPDKKELARDQIAGALRAGGYGRRELVVRTNSLDTPWGVADLRAAAAAGADAVLLPKVEDVSMVQRAFAALEGAPTAIWVMVETPLGVLRAESLAASPLVGCLVAGTNDLAADLRCDGAWAERAALLPSLAQMVLAARAHGKVALDGVHIDLADDAGLAASCDQGRRLGFDGKSLIHPKTIAAANAAFTPSADEVARARAIIAAFDAAAAAGSALAVLDGKLVEELHVRASRRLIAVAEACAES